MILNFELCFLYLNLLLFSYSVLIPACVPYGTPTSTIPWRQIPVIAKCKSDK